MKTLYIECNMGAAGDMLMAALLEICPDRESFIGKMNGLGLPGVKVSRTDAIKCGIKGTGISVKINGEEEGAQLLSNNGHTHTHEHVEHHHSHGDDAHHHEHNHENEARHHEHSHSHEHEKSHHHHAGMSDISAVIGNLPVSDYVKANALAVYDIIAQAESAVHGIPVNEIHFHEVGNMDAIADIVGVCILMEILSPERVAVSPVHVGSGHVHAAHGILPVPAPATAYILKGIPFYSGKIKGELLTPTGAALLKHFADVFSEMPVMEVDKIGYGMGKKDFEAANCVRVFYGEAEDAVSLHDKIMEISCNLDDMTPEAIGFASNLLMENGALDVFTVPIFMKKNRPAHLLVCLCTHEQSKEMASLILKHTSTNGVRLTEHKRYKLDPAFSTVNTSFGQIKIKTSSGYGITKVKPEYEDVAECAKKHGVSFETVYQEALKSASIE